MSHWLTQLIRRLRPPQGWGPVFLLLATHLIFPASITWISRQRNSVWFLTPLVQATGAMMLLTGMAVLAGVRAAHSRLSRPAALAIASLLGTLLSPTMVARILPPVSLFWNEFTSLLVWLGAREPGGIDTRLPFSSVVEFVSRRLSDLGARLWWDVRSVVHGASLWETQTYLLFAAFLAWIIAFVAAWQTYRERSALAGLLPSGVCLALVVLYYPTATPYLIAFLVSTLWLVAACNLWEREEDWRATGTDYPDGLGLELSIRIAPWMLILLLLAGLLPVRGFGRVSQAFWRQAERLFGPLEGEQWYTPFSAGTLPRSHLLGRGPKLGDSVVFYVATNDPAPPLRRSQGAEQTATEVPQRYWRGDTYDVYTGKGWTTSPLQVRSSTPGSPFFPDLSSGFDLWQRFEIVASGSEALYGANTPYQVDQSVQTWWRAPNDLVRITSDVDTYTVISRSPEPSEQELQTAPTGLPLDVADLYLTLPNTVPRRVYDLAELIVADSDTPFEKSQALETFLRAYTYSLELEDPPDGRDVVDYFLFDLQKGYCDYYASAMVVLARAVGVPARLASGYAQGTYDHESQRWVVTEQDAHSWAEIYFEGTGWVEFEPTAALPTLLRAGGSQSVRPEVPPLPPRTSSLWSGICRVFAAAVVVLVLLLAAARWLWVSRRDTESGPDLLIRDRFARLLTWGIRLGQVPRAGQTAYEYSEELADELLSRGVRSRWTSIRQAMPRVRADVATLTEAFVHAQYGLKVPPRETATSVTHVWKRLRRRLWSLWLHMP